MAQFMNDEQSCYKCIHLKVCKNWAEIAGHPEKLDLNLGCTMFVSTADVVPKSEVERLESIIETQREAICSECRKYHRLLDDCSWSLNSDPEPSCRGCEWNTAKG